MRILVVWSDGKSSLTVIVISFIVQSIVISSC